MNNRQDNDCRPLRDARANHLRTDWDTLSIATPWFIGRRVVQPPLDELVPFIDWTSLPVSDPRDASSATFDPSGGNVVARHERALAALRRVTQEYALIARGVYGFWPANAKGDDIIVYKDDARQREIARFHMLRQQAHMAEPNLSLADFIAPRDSFAPDYIGAFVVTAGVGLDQPAHERGDTHDESRASLISTAADQLAHALAEWLHAQARNDWGYGGESRSSDDLVAPKYRGIRAVFGQSACPDPSETAALFSLLDAPAIGATLTESFTTVPTTSVAGLYFSHPSAQHFDLGRLGRDQIDDYAQRKGARIEQVEHWLASHL